MYVDVWRWRPARGTAVAENLEMKQEGAIASTEDERIRCDDWLVKF
jgi:hypothetical protein